MRRSIGVPCLLGVAALLVLAVGGPAHAAAPNPEAAATCTTDDGVTCTIYGWHTVPSGTVLDYGDRHVVLAGELTLGAGPGPRSLTIRTAGDFVVRASGRIGTENRAHSGRDGGDLTLAVGGALTLHGHLDLDGHPSHGTGGTLVLTTGGPLTVPASGAILADGYHGGTLTLTIGGDLTLTGRLDASGEGRGAHGGTISLAATTGLTFTRTARLNAEGHLDGTITLAAPDPLDPGRAWIEPPFTRVPLGSICGLSPLQVARANHTAPLLSNGTVLLAGGRNGSGPVDSLELFDPATGVFAALVSRLSARREGHTATLLLDGTVLITGGTDGGYPLGAILDTAFLFDPVSGSVAALSSQLASRRVGHTATLLPDGTVLIVGGTSDGSTPLDTAELFNPTTQSFSALGASTELGEVSPGLSPSKARLAAPRVGHSATLLPDGTVLILGGTSDGTTSPASGELFDPAAQTFRPASVSLLRARRGHTATLLGDGTLLVTGGFGSGPLPTAERLSLGLSDQAAPTVVVVRPPDQATEVPSDSRLAIRFSEPLNPTSVSGTSFLLIDQSTTRPIDSSVTIAEGGLLAFLTPAAPLTAGRTYTVQLTSENRDTSGNPLVPFTSAFTVQGAAAPLTLLPDTLPLVAGQTGTLTVQLPAPAPASGITVTLESANAGIASVPPSVSLQAGQISTTILVAALSPGTVNVMASAPGFTSASATVTVLLPPPTITNFTPTSGKVGTTITITGTHFVNVQSVTFNGVPASGFTVTGTTTITVAVPPGATRGPLTVTTPGGSFTTAGHFLVLPTQAFSLQVEPTTMTAIAGTSVNLKVSTVTTEGYTGLTQVSTGALPTGVTATFYGKG